MCYPAIKPQRLGTEQKEGSGVRSGAASTSPSPRHAVSSSGRGKQTGLASGQGGLSGVALPGQGLASDRTGRDGRRLIDAGHYSQPRKLGQLQIGGKGERERKTERRHSNRGKGSRGRERFHPN